ncbi:hypothetical protein KUCAC02_037730 [Chaenocephalus aceratus]|nr:hypothetical protein KUCAC02_037730 [Chaenocephalus aceratus]
MTLEEKTADRSARIPLQVHMSRCVYLQRPELSSSSGPTSSSGSGTLSSVDTIPVTLSSVPEEARASALGRLLPHGPGLQEPR